MTYTGDNIKPKLSKLPGWNFTDNKIEKKFTFKSFTDAILFMIRVSYICESLNHHPEWTNMYNKLLISLSTHDEGGVTDKDLELANEIEKSIT